MKTCIASGLVPLLRIFFNLLYHQFAWSYDIVSGIVSIGMWNEWIKSVLPELAGQRILELGHGPGHLQISLLQKGKLVAGIDLSPQMGHISGKRIRKANLQPLLVNGASQRLPFPDNSFNQIVSTFPTQYIFSTNTIEEIYRVLNTYGEFIILPVAWITGGNLLHKMAAWLFKVTGESTELDEEKLSSDLSQFERFGFSTEFEIRELENSQVLILRGKKM